MEEDDIKEYSQTLAEARHLQKIFNLESVDTALLILMNQTLDQIRFHNSD